MKIEFHPATDRGHANYGWLDTWHSFSFADYFNPVRERFGCLRVLNDDTIAGGSGFDEHPHNNMEIISIPLAGKLAHRDSMGHTEVIGPGSVQVMSAGTGITHSEYNYAPDESCHFLQLWIFPRSKNMSPRYDQKEFDNNLKNNRVQCLVSPDTHPEEEALWIRQDAWVSISRIESGKTMRYDLHKSGNVVFLFMIEGKASFYGQYATKRDAVGLSDIDSIEFSTVSESELLIIETPVR